MSAAADSTLEPSPPRVRSRIWPTREGLGWLFIAALLLVQGYLRGVNLVALIACLLLALWALNVVWVISRFGLKRLRLRRHIASPVYAAEPFSVSLELSGKLRRKQPGLRVIDRGSHHQHAWYIPALPPGGTVQTRYEVVLPRRGKYLWPDLRLTTGYPFGLLRRWLRVESRDATLVLPQLGRLERNLLQRLLMERCEPSTSQRKPIRRHAAAQTEFYGLREFRAGDSPRWIHWRTSARVGELMVREYIEPPLENLIVLLEPWLPDTFERLYLQSQLPIQASGLPSADADFRTPQQAFFLLEKAVSLAATLCFEWTKQPGARVALGIADVKADSVVVDSGVQRGLSLLERLAVVEGTPQPAAAELVGRMQRDSLPAAPVVLICTRRMTSEELFVWGLGRPVLVLNVADPLVDELFCIGGANGHPLINPVRGDLRALVGQA
jgi:uncharacterized protein (DUF58 family)